MNLDIEQYRWFCQFVPLYRAKGELYFGEDNDWLYLDEYSSALLWEMLAQAKALGVALVGMRTNTRIMLASPARGGPGRPGSRGRAGTGTLGVHGRAALHP